MTRDQAVTIDLWVRPEALGGDLLAFPAKPKVTLRVTPTGVVELRHGGDVVLAANRRLTADGAWYHVALVLRQNGSAALSVNGTPAPGGEPTVGNRGVTGISGDFQIGGSRLVATVDAIRVRRGEQRFYELQEDVCDPLSARPLTRVPPFFSSTVAPTFGCSFDGTLNPQDFAGLKMDLAETEGMFVPGVRGEALDLSEPKVTDSTYVGMDVLPDAAGTIEFWFRPRDWDNATVGDFMGTNVPAVSLFRVTSAKLSAHYHGYRTLRVRQGRAAREVENDLIPVHPGKWTHAVVTWGPAGTRVYLDGVPQLIPQVTWGGPAHIFDREEHANWLKRTDGKQDGTYRLLFNSSHTLIDELRIYPWAMRPAEVRNAHNRFFADAAILLKPLPPVDATFDYFAHAWDPQERLQVALRCLPVEDVTPHQADLVLRTASGEVLGRQDAVALDKTGQAAAIFKGALPFGDYEVEVTRQRADGERLPPVVLEYQRLKPAWYANELGKERSVPPPWTPIRVAGTTVDVWGRTVTLAATGLPAQIRAVGQDLLAAPISIHGRANGEDVALTGDAVSFTDVAADRVQWQAALRGGALGAKIDAWMEYDGLIYVTVDLHAVGDQPVALEKLQVDIPMSPAVASQLICNGAGQNFRASWDIRMIPDGEGSVWNTRTSKPEMQQGLRFGSFCSQIWLGGDRAGLSLSGENDKGWTPDSKTAAQEIIRRDGAVVLRLNVISLPVKVGESRPFHFILTPTPTKPEPAGWRGWNRMEPGTPLAAYDVIDDFIGFPLKSDPANPESLNFELEPKSWEAAATQAASIAAKFGDNNPVFFYMDYSWPRPGPGFADWNHDLWAGTGRIAWTMPELEDYMVWIINEYIKRGLIDGLYVDDVSVGRTYSLAGTAYSLEGAQFPVPEGLPGRRQGFNFMGYRRFCQRIWKLLVAQGKDPHILSHMTYCFEVPALSFNTSIVNGEARMIGLGAKHDTMDNWSRDELRIMGRAPKWGFATFWKPTVEIKGKIPKAMDAWYHGQTRAMHANVMQADMWYLWHYPSARNILPSLYEFGMGDPGLRFIPYWEDTVTEVTAEAVDSIEVGLFVRPGRALVMISNFARQDQEVTLKLLAERLFPEAQSVVWRDIDCSLEAPESGLASPAEMAELGDNLNRDDLMGDGEDELPDGEALEEMLAGVDPVAKERERLAMHADGDQVRLIVRQRDYRLLEVRPE